MTQQRSNSNKQKKSDFPIFEYLDKLMPDKLVSRFAELPRHVRWTIISSVASLIILWIVLRVVVGGLNSWLDNQGEFLTDAYYLPYPLMERPFPAYPEAAAPDDQFRILPATIGDQYVLQVPLTETEQDSLKQMELDSFLALSQPAEAALASLRHSLSEQLGTAAEPAAEVVEPTADSAAVPTDSALALVPTIDLTVMPTMAPTVDPIQTQINALDQVLATLVPLNAGLQTANSIEPVYGVAPELQNKLNALTVSGITLPADVESFSTRISELAALEPPIIFHNSECLMDALVPEGESEDRANRPCGITQRALYVEQGDYIGTDGTAFNVVVAEFPRSVDAAWAVKQLFYRARKIGNTGNFALDNIIEYNYAFSQIDGVYTLVWSHDNWVYSVSSFSTEDIDRMMQVFPY